MPIVPTIQQLQREFGLRTTSIPIIKTAVGRIANPAITAISGLVTAGRSTRSNNPYASSISTISAMYNPDRAQVRDADYNLLGKSLGNPVFTSVTFESISYTRQDGTPITTPRIDLETVIITCSFPRKVVKTEIQGRNGTVKEYIGEDDAQIEFNGMICGANGQYPYDEVLQMLSVIQAPTAIEVVSPYLMNLGISSVVFETREIGQQEGGYSYQPFSLKAVSDTPQELRVTA